MIAGSQRMTWDDAPLPYQSIAEDGTILEVNAAWEVFTGYSADEVVGRPYAQTIVPESHLHVFRETFGRFMEQGYLDGDDCFMQSKDGSVRNVLIYGRLAGVVGARISHCMVVDVTEHRATELALVESERRFRLLFDCAPNPIVVHDGTTIVFANGAAATFLGYENAEALAGLKVSSLVHPDSLASVAERVKRMVAEDWVAPIVEERFIRRDGTIAVGETTAVPMTMDDRRLIYVAATDTSARELAERALHDSEAQFRTLFESSPDAIVVHDETSAYFANPAAIEQFGLESGSDVAGVRFQERIHPDSLPLARSLLARVLAGEKDVPPAELRLLRRDGTEWVVEAISSRVRFGDEVRVQTIFRDLTERKKTESELARYRAELERLVEERTRSLDRVRAELDSVTAVIGRTVELRDPYTAGHQRRVAELAAAIAAQMGMPPDEVDHIRVAGAMHDIGKISVPAEILSKPGSFSALEYELVKTHAKAGYDIVASAEIDGRIAEIVYQHHERLDGTGYPRGLTADSLLPGARVLMVADVVEAMMSHRPYRPAVGDEAALAEIRDGSGTRYDCSVVSACIALFEGGFEFEYAD